MSVLNRVCKPFWGTVVWLLVIWPAAADTLQQRIEQLTRSHKATVGVSVVDPWGYPVVELNGSTQFPLQSVFKFYQALYVLHLVQQNQLSLQQPIRIERKSLLQNSWSPMLKQHKEDNFSLTLAELLRYAVRDSDNNACDLLFDLTGGPAQLELYLRQLGIQELQIRATERQMHSGWSVQFENWSSVGAASRILQRFLSGQLLNAQLQPQLWLWMSHSSTGQNRLRGQLPKTAVVAHKTGTSGIQAQIRAAVNDTGVILLPDGRAVLVTVFITASRESLDKDEALMAAIGRAVWDFYLQPPRYQGLTDLVDADVPN
ncbi:class A beta-lactamase [Rheinheimera sp.]|uniref:class A beta-lactamase n=1 Tax=Rheinheimera sp. TaxID=1869214 RepID=UPI00307D0803